MNNERIDRTQNNQARVPVEPLVRPNIRAHNNPVMHLLGKVIRLVSNTVLYWFDQGKFRSSDFQIKNIRIPINDLPDSFDGYRIIHISDIHLGTWMNTERLRGIVGLVNEQQPDLICITGDFVTHEYPGVFDILQVELSNLNAADGVLAVLGNHDYWSNVHLVRAALEECGIEELKNEVKIIRKGSEQLYFAGLDDVYNSKDQLSEVVTKIPKDKKAILLVHVPDFADLAAATGRFSLQLSGHSHGGQIRLPKIGALVLPPLAKKYVYGEYRILDMVHYTTSGVGTATIPIRHNCPPEIVIFELQPENFTVP